MKLTELTENQCAKLKAMHLPLYEKRRLMHLGFYEGIRIRFIRKAPMNDPSIYEVCGNEIILREKDAEKIEVEVLYE